MSKYIDAKTGLPMSAEQAYEVISKHLIMIEWLQAELAQAHAELAALKADKVDLDAVMTQNATLDRVLGELATLKAANEWIAVTDRLPKHKQNIEVVYQKHNKKFGVTTAEYIASRSIREEDYIDPDYAADGFSDYEEETDTYWAPSGFYEMQVIPDVNWFLDVPITHWRPLPAPAEVKP